MIEIKMTLGQDAFKLGQFVYVWLDGSLTPFYVGETAKSPIDRAGLHVRDSSRSGAIVGKIIQQNNLPTQEYMVFAFEIENILLNDVALENGASVNTASHNRARKAIERKVFDVLREKFSDMHKARGCTWSAECGAKFAQHILQVCCDRKFTAQLTMGE